MTRILLVDDHPLLRQGIAMTIEAEADFQVVAQAGDADEALALFAEVAPDLVITDISLPGANGLELMKNLLTLRPDLPVLVVSRHDEDLYAERAIRAGARGYVSKLAAGDQIVSAIRRVLRGGIHLSEALKDRMLFGAAAGVKDATQTPLEVLSDRELEVFEMTGRGIPTREISERLHLSVKTVESYRSRLKAKLGITNGTELIKHAVAWVQGEGSGRQPTA